MEYLDIKINDNDFLDKLKNGMKTYLEHYKKCFEEDNHFPFNLFRKRSLNRNIEHYSNAITEVDTIKTIDDFIAFCEKNYEDYSSYCVIAKNYRLITSVKDRIISIEESAYGAKIKFVNDKDEVITKDFSLINICESISQEGFFFDICEPNKYCYPYSEPHCLYYKKVE